MSDRRKEYRVFNHAQLRAEGDSDTLSRMISGYAAVFNSDSVEFWGWEGPFTERIAPGSFKKSLASNPDVRALIDHQPSLILGRTKSGTLRLKEDETGLFCEIDAPDTQIARDLIENMRLGNIDQMSFGFYMNGFEWRKEDGKDIRLITECELFDVSIVTYPAYEETSVKVRSAVEQVWKEHCEKQGVPLDILTKRQHLIELA